jgi:hypothetical protein
MAHIFTTTEIAAFSFDGTEIKIAAIVDTNGWMDTSYQVTVTEGEYTVSKHTNNGDTLQGGLAAYLAHDVKVNGVDKWTADRVAFCFGLAARRLNTMTVKAIAA